MELYEIRNNNAIIKLNSFCEGLEYLQQWQQMVLETVDLTSEY